MFALEVGVVLLRSKNVTNFFDIVVVSNEKQHLKFVSVCVNTTINYQMRANRNEMVKFPFKWDRIIENHNGSHIESMIYDNKTKAAAWMDQKLWCRHICGHLKYVC